MRFWPIWGIFRAFRTSFGALGTQLEIFREFFYSAQLDMKIQIAAKFQKKADGRLSRISPDTRMDARTDGRH